MNTNRGGSTSMTWNSLIPKSSHFQCCAAGGTCLLFWGFGGSTVGLDGIRLSLTLTLSIYVEKNGSGFVAAAAVGNQAQHNTDQLCYTSKFRISTKKRKPYAYLCCCTLRHIYGVRLTLSGLRHQSIAYPVVSLFIFNTFNSLPE